ncbi:hypothetical protein EH165_00300 [Nakamurella antarctica]|uniref:NHL repeat-containing protein n=1 Tax=Nakamurella antarctica TaxID=1902245 RepID=A0A3G8ZI16_9ACTN|nr:hypothetical protein [Nakamurella antarctica]AZI56840.1 hypothetical protein EH165_00300 [Nakamurella antarctica]
MTKMDSEPVDSEPVGTEVVGTEVVGTEPVGTEPISSGLVVRIGERDYHWTETDARFGLSPGLAHQGVAALAGGGVVTASASGNHLVLVGASPAPMLSAELEITECHDMWLDNVPSEGAPSLWVADNGFKPMPTGEENEPIVDTPGRVVRLGMDGVVLQEISAAAVAPELQAWRPTSIAVTDDRIWVADGYGQSAVHCFTRAGELLWSKTTTTDGIRLHQPHAIAVDPRSEDVQILVADRGNRRILRLSSGGDELGSFGGDILTSPSGFAFEGNTLWVTELGGGLVTFDENDVCTARYGDPTLPRSADWPNERVDGVLVRPTLVPGTFRSPHGIAVDAAGAVHVTEWLIGGRLITLTPA